jgi:hypothetical protein
MNGGNDVEKDDDNERDMRSAEFGEEEYVNEEDSSVFPP